MALHAWAVNDEHRTLDLGGGDSIHDVWCEVCRVVAPEWHFGQVLVSHGNMPLACPGPEVAAAHHFYCVCTADHSTLECRNCLTTLTTQTQPNTLDWECPRTGGR